MQYSVVLAGIIATTFATLSLASPLEARRTTAFQVSGFTASCSGSPDHSPPRYAATMTSIPDGTVVTATHIRTGFKTFPPASGFWTTNNTAINIRLNGLEQADKRIAITDTRDLGSPFTYSHISPAAEWLIVDGYQKYIGPSSFETEFNQS